MPRAAPDNPAAAAGEEPAIGYAVAPGDQQAILAATESEKLDRKVRKRVITGLQRTANGRAMAAFATAQADPTGALELTFLKQWVKDPTLGFLTIEERASSVHKQKRRFQTAMLTFEQIKKLNGDSAEVAQKLVDSCFSSQKHPQRPNDPSLRLYEVGSKSPALGLGRI